MGSRHTENAKVRQRARGDSKRRASGRARNYGASECGRGEEPRRSARYTPRRPIIVEPGLTRVSCGTNKRTRGILTDLSSWLHRYAVSRMNQLGSLENFVAARARPKGTTPKVVTPLALHEDEIVTRSGLNNTDRRMRGKVQSIASQVCESQ
jgi:hypothetical protein